MSCICIPTVFNFPPDMSEIEPRPKDLITVDTSAITPVKNSNSNLVRNQLVPKTKLNSGKIAKKRSSSTSAATNSLLKTNLSSARANSMKTLKMLKPVSVVIVPEGFIGDFSQDEI